MARARGVSIVAAFMLSAAISGAAFGEVRRERPARRPYITEVGQPYAINAGTLDDEIHRISDLRTYVTRYGYPDFAEIQEITPEWPWKPYEVRLYYLDRDVEADFGAVNLSPATPNFGIMKFHGTMTPQKRREVAIVLRSRLQAPPPRPTDSMEALVSRVEAAAERAVQAADRAVAESEAAARAAERTAATVRKMERRPRHTR
ncbi:MAG: hypothetical protein U0587_14620 [Candidatus Binatia bacterium]